jgi:hypothetical protein
MSKRHLGDPFGLDQKVKRYSLFTKNTAVNNRADGFDVNYWAAYAKGLKAGVKDLISSKDNLLKIALERKAIDAGLRAVIRLALSEIRKIDPNHPLLIKDNRDRVFREFEVAEMKKILTQKKEKFWSKPVLSDADHSSE